MGAFTSSSLKLYVEHVWRCVTAAGLVESFVLLS